jgi:hypothetical protein
MMNMRNLGQMAAVAVLLPTFSACAGANLGGLGDVLGGVLGQTAGGQQQQAQVMVEVQSVDTRQQAIRVRTNQGETGTVYYDQNTVVVYQQQQYPVTALESGDVANMQIMQTSDNRIYTNRIDVQQSVQERNGGQTADNPSGGRLQQLAGRISQIDYNRGTFQLQMQQGAVVVALPYNPGQPTNDYFRRLRVGDSVRIEGTLMESGRVELYRFI